MFNLIAVDDEKDVRVLFEHFFHKEVQEGKLTFYFANSAQECLSHIKDLDGSTVVLSDINMPEMSGIELLKHLSQNYPQVKVLLVSAYDQSRYIEEMNKWGADGYISKPVDFSKLKEQIFKLVS